MRPFCFHHSTFDPFFEQIRCILYPQIRWWIKQFSIRWQFHWKYWKNRCYQQIDFKRDTLDLYNLVVRTGAAHFHDRMFRNERFSFLKSLWNYSIRNKNKPFPHFFIRYPIENNIFVKIAQLKNKGCSQTDWKNILRLISLKIFFVPRQIKTMANCLDARRKRVKVEKSSDDWSTPYLRLIHVDNLLKNFNTVINTGKEKKISKT